jgi:hypothetical protein
MWNPRKTTLGILVLAAVALTGAACQRQDNSNAAIERAIQDHLRQRSDLAMGQMVMELQQAQVEGDHAEAEVVFRTMTDPPAQMGYHYQLRREGNTWRVEGGSPSAGDPAHSGAGQAPGPGPSLPEGHPPLEGMPPTSPQEPSSENPSQQ